MKKTGRLDQLLRSNFMPTRSQLAAGLGGAKIPAILFLPLRCINPWFKVRPLKHEKLGLHSYS